MTAVADIIRDALSHLRVQDPRQPVKPENARDAIRALNLMMAAWEVEGVSVGWSAVVEPTDELPAPPEAEGAIGYNLALRLRQRFGVPLQPDLVGLARDTLATLHAQVLANVFVRVSYEDLPSGEGQRYGRGDWREGFTG
ncbi:packaged DNA stabilization gp4 family protein [Lysobacter enzymogenes]|uniref:packaged DNA stabilization gp4 family protein n=1 Tax=Lysobacter enzymogenes TaxID=69 RepID=UPI00089C7235|nr:packaged DNA stabilization gp4 family protein [Lysobacter enzymogenes]SDX52852.1 P22 tail accessory factor [Lysobacter enzymogenes]